MQGENHETFTGQQGEEGRAGRTPTDAGATDTAVNPASASDATTCGHCDGEGTEVVMGANGYEEAPCTHCPATHYVHTGHDGSALHTAGFAHRLYAAEHAADAIVSAMFDTFGWKTVAVELDDANRIPVSVRLAIIEEDGSVDMSDADTLRARIAAQVDRHVHHDGAYRFDAFGVQVRIVPA